ncbi:MAG: hypothetical protein JWR07_4776 [Nevskia sp.]|nr:hypothetical protein [Nevskia sp.]
MFVEIVRHTPSWVWLLLAALLWRGYGMTRPQQVTQLRVAMLPALFTALSFGGVLSTFGAQPGALLCWASGLVLSAYEVQRHGAPKGAAYLAQSRSYALPGSWVPLLLIVLIFVVKYGVGIQLALHGELRQVEPFVLAVSTAYGALSGVFLGRALRLWHLQRKEAVTLDTANGRVAR